MRKNLYIYYIVEPPPPSGGIGVFFLYWQLGCLLASSNPTRYHYILWYPPSKIFRSPLYGALQLIHSALPYDRGTDCKAVVLD